MRIKISRGLTDELRKIKRRDRQLAARIEKQLVLFSQNPTHPSLRLHKLTGNLKNRWSISITTSIRMVYVQLEENVAYFVAIGTHEEVYGK